MIGQSRLSLLLIGAALLAPGCVARGQQEEGAVLARTPAHHEITADRLPPPFATGSANNGPNIGSRPANAPLYVPPGFQVRPWASDLDNPRFLCVAPNGDVFVSESRANRVSVLRPGPGNAGPALRSEFLHDLRQPFGIAFFPPGPHPSAILIANTDSLVRFPYRNGDLKARGSGEVLVRLPGGGYNQHWTRTVLVAPDGRRIFISVGSRHNIAVESPPRAAIMEYNPDGTGGRVYASGLRNAVGLAFNPVSGALWAAVNERDAIGDDLPPDYVTSVRDGGFYGWPYYYSGPHHDPRMPEKPDLAARTLVPDVLLEAHCAALSVLFYQGGQFPAEYRNDGFVTMHGSWNRHEPDGYKVVRVRMRPDGRPRGGYDDFVWGWKAANGRIWGRPVAMAAASDGSLLLSDDGGNLIWRISYTGRPTAQSNRARKSKPLRRT